MNGDVLRRDELILRHSEEWFLHPGRVPSVEIE
jgi:hypothetical protein